MKAILGYKEYQSYSSWIQDFIDVEYRDVDNKNLNDIISYIISSPGKRMRSGLLFAGVKILDGKIDKNLAMIGGIIEMIHTTTLVHDDVIDLAIKRRSKLVPNIMWDNKSAILVGDFIFAKTFNLMSQNLPIEIVRVISKTCQDLTMGEFNQMKNEGNSMMKIDDYINVIKLKTGVLFSCSMQIAGIVCNKNPEEMAKIGMDIGIAFQMLDDIMDYFGKEKENGKTKLLDISEGKITLPMIILLENASSDDLLDIRRIISSPIENESISKIIQYMRKYDIKEKSLSLYRDYINKTLENISKITGLHNNILSDTIRNMEGNVVL
jgi:octaprenyl-diphosphate synthase